MIDWFLHSVAAQLGLAGLVIAGCLAAAYFLPPFRKPFLAVAGIVFAAASIYAKGASDASRREKEKQAERERKAVQKGTDARAAAKRDVARGVRDGYQRD